ncbi:MAG: helix-turn-helix domain-containing protein [Firmicutes bacterium]|nr:helix-turn-helix domain-containing protein [Bacillota bacterium]
MDYFERVRKIVNYIEANLHNDISLDGLARQAFFSSCHFHRIFQTITGDSVMEYIRKRRLAKAAVDLRFSDKKIVDIALEYNFNSPETFTRAFKRYYGVSPEIYRHHSRQSVYFETKTTAKEAHPMYDWNLSQRIQCDDVAKQECLEVLNLVVSTAEKARQCGLLSLEADLEQVQPFLLRKGIQLITSGIEPGAVRDTLETYIMAGDYRGKELLIRHMIMEGILMIQAGEHPRIIGIKLTAFLGESYTETVEKSLKSTQAEIIKELQEFFEKIKDTPPYSTATALLEEPFNKLNDRCLQRLIRDIDEWNLVCAMKGASGKTQIRIFHNLPKMAQLMFCLTPNHNPPS